MQHERPQKIITAVAMKNHSLIGSMENPTNSEVFVKECCVEEYKSIKKFRNVGSTMRSWSEYDNLVNEISILKVTFSK
jgi:hypothetical protein